MLQLIRKVGKAYRIYPCGSLASVQWPSNNYEIATMPDDRSHTRGMFGVSYTLLTHDRFGAVDWSLKPPQAVVGQ